MIVHTGMVYPRQAAVHYLGSQCMFLTQCRKKHGQDLAIIMIDCGCRSKRIVDSDSCYQEE